MNRRTLAFCAATLFSAVPAAHAYIEKVFSIQDLYDKSMHIGAGVIESADPSKNVAVILITESLKGEFPQERVTANLNACGVTPHIPAVMRQLVVGASIVIFYTDGTRKDIHPAPASLSYINGFFFQMWAPGGIAWPMSHFELKMGRTFQGSADDLIAILQGMRTGKMKPPEPNPGVPELTPAELMKRPPPGPRKKGKADAGDKKDPPAKKSAAGSSPLVEKSDALKALVDRGVKAGKFPVFRLGAVGADVIVKDLDASGRLALEWGGNKIDYPWSKLAKGDLRNLAESVAKLDPEGRDLAAWFETQR